MTAMNEERMLHSYEVAYLYGYRASPDHPMRKHGEPAGKDKEMNRFYVAMGAGLVPQPDARVGKYSRWFRSTIEADFAARKKKRAGRPMKTRGAA